MTTTTKNGADVATTNLTEAYAYTPATGLGDPLADRLLGVITALAGELFTCKAEIEHLRRQLVRAQVLDAETAGQPVSDPAMAEWMKVEAAAYAKHLLDPLAAQPGQRLFRFGLAPEDAAL